ncbi:MAG: mechanosensitive ion channel [Candidatus Omnitrophica bacterium]|nr:mechanosensitive ion channel [Candidatus Omnitrophota bacterium]
MEYLIGNAIKVAIACVIAAVIYFIAISILKKWDNYSFSEKIKLKTLKMKAPLAFLIPAMSALFLMPLLNLPKNIYSLVIQMVSLWLIASIGSLVMGVVNALCESILYTHDINASDNLEARKIHTQIRVMKGIITAGIFVITAACMLMTFPKIRQIGVSFLASAGLMSVILGFAAQKTLGNFIAGIQIAITQPIRIDDVLVIEGEWGWVEEITLTYVVVRIWDLRRLILPISYFTEKPFQNWTRISADILGTVYIYADYTVPIEKLREKLTESLEESKFWDKKVNVLQVTNTTEKTVELRALMSAKNSPAAWQLRCEVREKLLVFLQQNYPSSLPKIRIDLGKEGSELYNKDMITK